ncbi:unnamed protein product [Rangifer tarandus platyrhynchus]|uniref:Uncharacterized protein n=1 Tax=Rangifer tarandus platyrhynchus TaxID=3082113 RepID=A0ABN8ZL60_RANTA|nr:unnamed protein product [Rangifer tarandus platyrhynchus]
MRVAVVRTKLESGWLPGGARQLRSGNTEWDQSRNSMPPRRGHSAGPRGPGVFGRTWEALTRRGRWRRVKLEEEDVVERQDLGTDFACGARLSGEDGAE